MIEKEYIIASHQGAGMDIVVKSGIEDTIKELQDCIDDMLSSFRLNYAYNIPGHQEIKVQELVAKIKESYTEDNYKIVPVEFDFSGICNQHRWSFYVDIDEDGVLVNIGLDGDAPYYLEVSEF